MKTRTGQILCTAGAALMAFSLFADVYVNPDTGSDTEHGGTSPTDAYQSLTKAMEGLSSGAVVYAAKGVYRLKSAESGDGYPARVVVPAGVTLVADGEGEAVIEGEEGMRCVWLNEGATLKGFTVRGGYIKETTATSAGPYGAGVGSAASLSTVRNKAFVEDCLITANTNNYRGAGISCVVARRCRILANKATHHGSAAYYGVLYNCIVDDNDSGDATCYQTTPAVNCTFGPGNNQRGFHKVSTTCKNCIFLGEMVDDKGDGTFKFDHCAFASDTPKGTIAEARIGEGSYLVPAAQIQLTDDYTPVAGACVAIDTGDNSAVDGETDVYGNARIYNEIVDMGAVEVGKMAVVTISAAQGGIAVSGGVIGENIIRDGETKTITITRTYDSPHCCVGFTLNGETLRFDDIGESWSRAFTADDGGVSIVAIYENAWYVDGTFGNDANDGMTRKRAFKTFATALTNGSMVDGDEVRVLKGVYRTDTMTGGDGLTARVAVPANIALVADGTAAETVIEGESGVRGVWLEKGATVRGFTIRNSVLTNGSAHGAGVASYNSPGNRNLAFVEDCVISNNTAAYRGGGIACVVARRCRILDNVGSDHASAASYGALYDCVVDGHATQNACTQNTTPIVNCTFGPRNALRAITKVQNIFVTNTLFMSEFQPSFIGSGYVTVDHCLFATNNASGTIVTATEEGIAGTGSRLVDYRDVRLKKDYSLRRGSAAIDAGETASAALPYDVFGAARVIGPAVDIGAAEWDPSKASGLMLLFR